MVWSIWTHRNNAIFSNQRVDPHEVLALANMEFARWQKGEPLNWKWGPTTQNDNILLVDGAWKKVDDGVSREAYGWVMERGMAKAHAILAGESNASKEWSTVNVYTNSVRIVQMIQIPQSAPTCCYHLILDILQPLKSFSSGSIMKVNRECIRKVHDLAIQAKKG
ncbi:5-hydroxytryptamine receptor 1A [Bienertia sinuspersici]